ncbi:MAG: YbjN domain-containing protein [Propionibacteriaceae bacterium]|nr:YbjN domain-containing protein [Propionibacteriaceae bacterium]
MGYFTRAGSEPTYLAPLTLSRIATCLDAHSWHYSLNDDGSITGWWDSYFFLFACQGEDNNVFYAHALGNRILPKKELASAIHHANEWNSGHLWPTVTARQREDSTVVLTVYAVEYSHGISDEQLDLHIRRSISTMADALESIDNEYPDYPLNN